MRATSHLTIQNLTVNYGRHEVINDFSIADLASGQIIGLIGPNGCGKSTLLKAIVGLIPIKKGHIALDEHHLLQMNSPKRAQYVGYLPQNLTLTLKLRVFESLLITAHATKVSMQTNEIDTIYRLLRRLGIEELALSYLYQLSGGQKQLVGLAQMLIRQPRLLLLDEPFSALDLNYQLQIINFLRQETQERGLITLVVLHDLNFALHYVDHMLVMNQGQLMGRGIPREVMSPKLLLEVFGIQGQAEMCSQGFMHVVGRSSEALF